MSDTAAWSYTSEATHWPRLGRSDWAGSRTFGLPVVFACDYKRGIAAKGKPDRERVASLSIYTERASIKLGDMVMIGASSAADPVAAGAVEVLSADEFPAIDGTAPDYVVEAG